MRKGIIFVSVLAFAAIAKLGLGQQGVTQGDDVVRLMEEYTNAPAPTGDEDAVRNLVVRDLRVAGADVSIDGMGSVIGILRGASDRPRIMVDAHMDELGLMVQYIRPDGFVAFRTLGYPDPWLIDKRWVILTGKGPVSALTGARDVHVWPAEERPRGVPREDIVLDVGATSKQEAEQLGIRPGDFVAPVSSLHDNGASTLCRQSLGRSRGPAGHDRNSAQADGLRRQTAELDLLRGHRAGGKPDARRSRRGPIGSARFGNRPRARNRRRRAGRISRSGAGEAGKRSVYLPLRQLDAAQSQTGGVLPSHGR